MPEKPKTYRTKTGKVLTDADIDAIGRRGRAWVRHRDFEGSSAWAAHARLIPCRGGARTARSRLEASRRGTRRSRPHHGERDHPSGTASLPRRRLTACGTANTPLVLSNRGWGFGKRPVERANNFKLFEKIG
jgi:hypothetical protein